MARALQSTELNAFARELERVNNEVRGMISGLTDEEFNWRANPDSWSISECIHHLSLTTWEYLPRIIEAIDQAKRAHLRGYGPFATGTVGRFFVHSMEPLVRRRFKAPPKFRPHPALPLDKVMPEFLQRQIELSRRIEAADGLDVGRVKLRSPALPILRLRLSDVFALLLAHQRRHVLQAQNVLEEYRAQHSAS